MSKLTLQVGARDHVQGPENAPVTLVEYGDYECSHCGKAYPVVKEVQKHFGTRLRFVFRNFPLTESHPHAALAAEAAEAVGEQGRFWEMHALLFENQRALDASHVLGYAGRAGADVRQVEAALKSNAFEPRVREDFMSGVRSGVNGTPTFFINGERFDGRWDLPGLTAAIDKATHTHAGGRRV